MDDFEMVWNAGQRKPGTPADAAARFSSLLAPKRKRACIDLSTLTAADWLWFNDRKRVVACQRNSDT